MAGITPVRIKIKRLEREKERRIGSKEGVARRKEGPTGMVQGRIQDYLWLVAWKGPEKEGGVSKEDKQGSQATGNQEAP